MISFAKKFMSVALAAVLLIGVLPAAAFAAEVEQDQNVAAVAAPAEAEHYIKYFAEDGVTPWLNGGWDQNTLEVDADGNYTLQEKNLPMNVTDPTGQGREFLGYWGVNSNKQAKVGDKIQYANLKLVFAEVKPTDPETKPTDPETKPTDPETKPTDPAVQQKFTVSFKTNCDVADPASITVTENGTYDNLPALTRTGYTFQGWSRPRLRTPPRSLPTATTLWKLAGTSMSTL